MKKNLNLQGPVRLKKKNRHKMLCSVERNQIKPLFHQRSRGLKCTENDTKTLSHQTEFLSETLSFFISVTDLVCEGYETQ